MEKMNKIELNERQKAVYAYLEMLNGERIKLKDLCEEMKYEFSDFEIDNPNFNNSSARRLLTYDIRAISNCDLIDKFVISNKNGVALATEKTYAEELEKEKIKILRMLKLYWKKVSKIKRNHQFVFDFENEDAKEIEALVRKGEK
jgi:hypothetical protein